MADVVVPDSGTPSVSEASETSGEATPMEERPAEPTEAQQEQAGEEVSSGPSDEAKAQARADAEWRAENPNKVLTRAANPSVAGESFAYLEK